MSLRRGAVFNHIALFIGHLIGDYFLQNDWMAVTKSQKGEKGHLACDVHCAIYAFSVALCVWFAGWRIYATHGVLGGLVSWLLAWGIAFVTHWPIDRWGLAGKWMNLYGQTTLDKLDSIHVRSYKGSTGVTDLDGVEIYAGPRHLFWAPVYIAVDNTMHLLLMWLLFSWAGEIPGVS
jgi:hypothetical protein